MTTPDPVFRAEAIEFHQRPSGPGPLVDLRRRWVVRLYRLMLGLLAVGTAAGAVIRVDGRNLFQVLFG